MLYHRPFSRKRIATVSEASDPNGDTQRKERNLHCDVHVTAKNKHTLPPFWEARQLRGLDLIWITRSHRSVAITLQHMRLRTAMYFVLV